MLSETFKTSPHDVFYSKIVGGAIIVEGNIFSAPENSEFKDGDMIRAIKLPGLLTFNGKKAVMVGKERWIQV